MAQLVKHLTLDFGSGHDLRVRGFLLSLLVCLLLEHSNDSNSDSDSNDSNF